MAVDPALLRALAARQQQQAAPSRRGVQVGSLQRLQGQQAAHAQAAQAPPQLDQLFSAAAAQRAPSVPTPRQHHGIIDTITNDITHPWEIPMQVLQAADYGRRGVNLGLSELKKALPTPAEALLFAPLLLMDEERVRADTRSNMAKLKDPTFGFGTYAHQFDNKWLNRGIGLAGDVAFDPLTYLTLGAGEFAGGGGRAALAMKAADAGLGEELSKLAGRFGPNAIKDTAAREALGLGDTGLRFAGKRIPGTGKLAEAGSGVLNKARNPAIDAKLGEIVRKFGVSRDPELRPLYEALVSGNTEHTAAAASAAIQTEMAYRGGKRETLQGFRRTVTKLGDKAGDNAEITRLVEEVGRGADPLADQIIEHNATLLGHEGKAGARTAGLENAAQNPDNYMLHLPTDRSKEVFDRAGIAASSNPFEAGSQQFERRIKPEQLPDGSWKSYNIEGKEFIPKTGSIHEANTWAERELGYKLYEDSPKVLMAHRLFQASEVVGKARRASAGLSGDRAERVLAGTTSDIGSHTQVDTAASKELGATIGEGVAKDLETAKATQVADRTALGDAARKVKDNVLSELKVDLGRAKGLSEDAQRELRLATTAAEKFGTPEEAIAKIGQANDGLIAREEAKLAAKHEQLDIARETERAHAVDVRGARTKANNQWSRARRKLEAEVAAGEDSVRRLRSVTTRLSNAERKVAALSTPVEKQVGTAAERKAARAAELAQAEEALRSELPATVRPEGPGLALERDYPAEWSPAQRQAFDAKMGEFRSRLDALAHDTETPLHLRQSQAKKIQAQIGAGERVAPVAEGSQAIPRPAMVPNPELEQRLGQLAAEHKAAAAEQKATARGAGGERRQALREAKAQVKALKGEKKAATAARDQQFLKEEQLVGFDAAREAKQAPVAEKAATRQAKLAERSAGIEAKRDEFAGSLRALNAKHDEALTAVEPLFRERAGTLGEKQANAAERSAELTNIRSRIKEAQSTTIPSKHGDYEEIGPTMRKMAGLDHVSPTTAELLDAADKASTQLAKSSADAEAMSKLLSELRSGKAVPLLERVANDGWQMLSSNKLLGRDLYVRDDMAKAMAAITKATHEDPGGVGKAIDRYTKFFKAWATSTPGFHIRNAIGATFMNLSEGVSPKQMYDGMRIFRAFDKYGIDGNWVDKVPQRLRGHAQEVIDTVYQSGAGGQFSVAEIGGRAFGDATSERGSWLYNNRWTRNSQALGEKIEGSVRAGLALKSLEGGESPMQALARVKRIHFDYSDVNETDQAVRRLIPFWTFMSRNLPLQAQQMLIKPRMYAEYNNLVRNFDVAPDAFKPDYFGGEGGFYIADNLGISPDVGPNQLRTQSEMLAHPSRLLSNLNPILKVPLQLATNRDLYYGQAYKKDDYQKVPPELRAFAGLLKGKTIDTPEGPVAEKRIIDSLYDIFPVLAQVNRLGSTTPNRKGKGLQAGANYFGVPLRQIDVAKAEAQNTKFSARDKANKVKARRKALAEFGGAA